MLANPTALRHCYGRHWRLHCCLHLNEHMCSAELFWSTSVSSSTFSVQKRLTGTLHMTWGLKMTLRAASWGLSATRITSWDWAFLQREARRRNSVSEKDIVMGNLVSFWDYSHQAPSSRPPWGWGPAILVGIQSLEVPAYDHNPQSHIGYKCPGLNSSNLELPIQAGSCLRDTQIRILLWRAGPEHIWADLDCRASSDRGK